MRTVVPGVRPEVLDASLVACAGDCYLVANAAENPVVVDWGQVAGSVLRTGGRVRIDGLLVVAHRADGGFDTAYFAPDGTAGVPAATALLCAARLIGQQYGYHDMRLHFGRWVIPATVTPQAVGVTLGTVPGLVVDASAGSLVRVRDGGRTTVLAWAGEERPGLDLPGAVVHVERGDRPGRLRARVHRYGQWGATLSGGVGAVAGALACRQLGLVPAGPVEVTGADAPITVDTAADGPPYRDVRLSGPAALVLSGWMADHRD